MEGWEVETVQRGATNLELNPDLWVVSAAGGLSDLPKRRLLDLLLVTGRGGGDIYKDGGGGGVS